MVNVNVILSLIPCLVVFSLEIISYTSCLETHYNYDMKKNDIRELRNLSVSISFISTINEKVEHYIRIKTHKPIVLRFWVESGVNALCGWAQVSFGTVSPQ